MAGLCRLVYPPHCLLCQNYLPSRFPYPGVCPRCQDTIIYNHPVFCLKCSRHISSRPPTPQCRICRSKKIAFDFAWGCCLYNDSLKHLLLQFKYFQKTYLRHYFTELMMNFIRAYQIDIEQFDYAVPIPLSSTRLRERGYNQAEMLAQNVAQRFDLRVISDNLIKTRHTLQQAQIKEKERWTNIRRAFTIKHPQEIRGKNILIVDDLLTTGATASEAALALKQAQAKRVGVLTLAITPT